MAGERATYEIVEWAEKLCTALDSMKENEKPGAVERGGKRVLLAAIREKIRELMRAGYSSEQIAATLKKSGFNVLPKSVTEAAREAKQPVTRAKREKKKSATPDVTESAPDNASRNAQDVVVPNAPTNAPRSGSFEIEPDTRDV